MEDEQLGLALERGAPVVVELPQHPVDGDFPAVRGVDEAAVAVRQDDNDAHVGVGVLLQAGERVDLVHDLVVPQVAPYRDLIIEIKEREVKNG